MAEPHSPPPEEQAVPGSIPDEAPFFSIVDFKCFAVRLSIVRAQVGIYNKVNNIGGLTMGAEMAEPHSSPPEEQAVPGSILDEAPFFSIVDFKRFAVRLSILRAQVGQHIMHTYNPYKAKCTVHYRED